MDITLRIRCWGTWRLRGLPFMADVSAETDLRSWRAAFIEESGGASAAMPVWMICLPRVIPPTRRISERMLNPHLRDAVARVVRDPQRKPG